MHMYCEQVKVTNSEQGQLEGRVGILIPAYNEADHLPRLLESCRKIKPAVVLVVDDGSSDRTPEVLERVMACHSPSLPLMVLRNETCRGKQGAVRRGLKELASWELSAVALVDGDLQHDPVELPGLARLLGRYDLVIGARSHEQMPLQRRVSNWLVNRGFEWIGGVDFVDVQSGLRIYRKWLVDVLADRLPSAGGFALEHESLTVLARYARDNRTAIRAAAAPITCAYGQEVSAIGPSQVVDLAVQTLRQALRFRRARSVAQAA